MQIEHTEFQDQLLRGLAHRMNNILTLFHGYVGLLLDNESLDHATSEGLRKMKAGASAASELMDRAHSLVRPSKVVWREVDLGELLRILRPNFEEMSGPDTRVELICPNDVPRLWADVSRLRTAVTEIVRNACEATTAGGTVTIMVSAEEPAPPPSAARQPTSWVTLTVTDSGPGIPEQAMPKIFTPFYSTKKKQNAAGLGLTVALGFVQQHGGVMRIESQPGRTICEVRLPSRADRA